MTSNENPNHVLAAIILGISLIAGLTLGGYFIGKGVTRFKSDARTVTVKGLVEKEVKADQAIWMLNFRRAGEDIMDTHTKITFDRDTTIAFLKKQGFKDKEISRQPTTRTIDKLARDYNQNQAGERFRYVVTSSVKVATTESRLVTNALGPPRNCYNRACFLMDSREKVWRTLDMLSRHLMTFARSFLPKPQKMRTSPLRSLLPIPAPRWEKFLLQTRA